MQIGIGLPATIPGASGSLILDWSRRAEARGFSSLGAIDRLVYPNYEPLVTLAAAAAVTQKIRLVTTVLIAPLRDTALLAKQAASLGNLSGGRLTLGLGVGGREDDYRAAGIPFKSRGHRFDEQLAEMKKIWSGQSLSADVGAIGPPPVHPGGPEILIGAYSPAAIQRVGRWADGFVSGGIPAEQARPLYDLAEQSWKAAGRPGKPRFVAGAYVGLGPNAAALSAAYIRNYYGFIGPAVEGMAQSVPSTPAVVEGLIASFDAIGLDELILWPCIANLDQVDLLADTAKLK